MLAGAEVLGQPARGVPARERDLAVAVEQDNRALGRRVVGERADEALARMRGRQCNLEPRAGDVEDLAIALGELALRASVAGSTRSHVRTSAGTSSAGACSARRRSSASSGRPIRQTRERLARRCRRATA
jgi:hypothetical protein